MPGAGCQGGARRGGNQAEEELSCSSAACRPQPVQWGGLTPYGCLASVLHQLVIGSGCGVCVCGGVALGEEAVLSGWLRLFPKREVSPAPRIPGEGRLGVAGGPNEGI